MRFLVVGGGSIGRRHIGNLKKIGYNDIVCLKRSHDSEFEKEHGVKVTTAFDSELSQSADAVIVATPTSLHNESLEFAVDHSLPIFMEKPLIDSVSGFEKARELIAKGSYLFFIGFMMRYHPHVKKIKEIIDSGELGKVYSARFEFGSYLPYWHPWEDYRISYASRKELGGGVINTITHELDLIQYYFGSPNALYCEAANFNKLEIEVEELSEAIFDYGDKTVTLHLDYLQKDYDRNIKILFDEGKVTWNWHENKVMVAKHKEEPVEILLDKEFDVNQLYVDELRHFLELIDSKKINHALDGNHALENTRITLKMHESSELNKKIEL